MSEVTTDDTVLPIAGKPWELMLPPGWWTIPTRAEESRTSIVRLLDHTFRGTVRDELVTRRIEIDRELTQAVARAGQQGATHVHTLVRPVRGVPVSATLVVTPVTIGPAQDVAEAFAHVLDSGGGVLEHGSVSLAGRPALRRVRRTPMTVEVAGSEVSRWQTGVDYVVDLGGDSLLMLGFTTLTDQVREAMVALFDAMAGTLRQRTS